MDRMLSIQEAAELIGVSQSRVSQLIGAGKLEASAEGGRRLVSESSALTYREKDRRPGRPSDSDRPDVQTFTLMCADYEVARVTYDPRQEYPLNLVELADPARYPMGVCRTAGTRARRELTAWWEHRSIPSSRPGVESKVFGVGFQSTSQLSLRSLGLSLSDCYWLRPEGGPALTWESVNFFDNDFVDRADGPWDWWLLNVGLDSPDNTSEGELPKKWVVRDGRRLLLKGSGRTDQQPYNEVAATRLFGRLLDPGEFVPYQIVETAGGPACSCQNFLRPREEFVPAACVKDSMGSTRGSSTYDRFARFSEGLCVEGCDVRASLAKMIVCDSILANSDRHWRNFGFVRNVDTLEMRPAPLFDTGNCLWYAKTQREADAGDWAFSARPFGPEPERQLALVERLGWFDAAALDGFVDEAVDCLLGSEFLRGGGRIDYVRRGLERRVANVTAVLRVLAYR